MEIINRLLNFITNFKVNFEREPVSDFLPYDGDNMNKNYDVPIANGVSLSPTVITGNLLTGNLLTSNLFNGTYGGSAGNGIWNNINSGNISFNNFTIGSGGGGAGGSNMVYGGVGTTIIYPAWNGPLGPIVELDEPPKTNGNSISITMGTSEYFGILHQTPTNLNVDFYYQDKNDDIPAKYVYSATIMNLHQSEILLNKDRFKNYVNHIEESFDTVFWTRKSNITEVVEWIDENTSGKWTISDIKTNHLSFNFVFQLENKIEAGHFALRWK